MNLIRFENTTGQRSNYGLEKAIHCGTYDRSSDIVIGDDRQRRAPHHTIWIPDGEIITDQITVETVNGQLIGWNREDHHLYFLLSGARGRGHNIHKKLVLPRDIELLASGGQPNHNPGSCNKITTVLFRVPRSTHKVVVGDMYYGEYSQVISFAQRDDEEWEVDVELYDRFCATHPTWDGEWSSASAKDGEASLPVPALLV